PQIFDASGTVFVPAEEACVNISCYVPSTDSTEENNLHKDLLTSLLILGLVVIIFLVLVGYFFRFRRHRKAVVTSGDKKMPNGILEEQEQQRVMLLSRSPSGPKKYFPIPVENLEEEIRIRSADEGKLFREEFN
ncbi:receptor-type tyrosine-protein phosphatase epsilon-like, partial [Empidonax traillii]|uniref:receptor-type tyrosine-protein phosphatase epsilon-like n=1 Tax=Empidonax traillii TaxID=164674 RepID=UPI000FFDB068